MTILNNENSPDFVKQIEAILKEHTTDYLLVGRKSASNFYVYSSDTTAYGMCEMIQQEIQNAWQYQTEMDYEQRERESEGEDKDNDDEL